MTVSIVASLALVACGDGSTGADQREAESGTDGFIAADQFEGALYAAADDFDWPNAFTPDLGELAARSGPPSGARVQSGLERVVLQIANTCAWILEWDAAQEREDVGATNAALDVITEVLVDIQGDEETRRFFADEVAQARLGDGSGLLGYVTANCSQMTWDGT